MAPASNIPVQCWAPRSPDESMAGAAWRDQQAQLLTELALCKWLPMRYNIHVITRQVVAMASKPTMRHPAWPPITLNSFRIHTYANCTKRQQKPTATPPIINTCVSVDYERLKVPSNHTPLKKGGRGAPPVSACPHPVPFILSSLTPNSDKAGAPPSGVGGWVLGSPRKASNFFGNAYVRN
jgi:hypothetical protein